MNHLVKTHFTNSIYILFLLSQVGSILGTSSLLVGDNGLPMLFLGCFAVGLAQGIGQFFRFSAIEVSPPDYKSKAVTIVLSGGIIAAGLGPGLAIISKKLLTPDYLLSYVIMGGVGSREFLYSSVCQLPASR